ncbi:hypothetical protein SSS_02067 [Sarcoptes scabiei]|uniref:GTPase-activating protein and VPS9 domain-containing protein 1 n=1 Tax=Sarcoptes scabiei TaxID=52283 RepID=A0A834RHC5_SARSC|nr:hypothetical protein SSS_02067 [Sarcoptes scabiei]
MKQFVLGQKKFGTQEIYLGKFLSHLKEHPKILSYLLFFTEKNYKSFIDLFSKIIISTLYNNCLFYQNRISLTETMEELLEIYLNFYDDLNSHLLQKGTAFGIMYRYFCDDLVELKSFFKLALLKPIMAVLSEDNLYLDIDSNRAVMRFCPEERQKHFGLPSSVEYQTKLMKFNEWTIKKLKNFVNNFIKSLQEHIYAFPASLIYLFLRIYSKLIERLDFQKVQAIFVNFIFSYLICPAIQNPDLFGITDLHINQIAHYNLMQCAQIIQILAVSNFTEINNNIYQIVCSHFEKNCIGSILEQIFAMSENVSLKSIGFSSIDSPYFIVSDLELKVLLEIIRRFLDENDQSDDPLNIIYNKLPQTILKFELDKNSVVSSTVPNSKSNFIKRNKSIDHLDSFNVEEQNEIRIEEFFDHHQQTISGFYRKMRQIFKIKNPKHSAKFFGMKSETKLLRDLKLSDKHLEMDANLDRMLDEFDRLIIEEFDNNQKESLDDRNLNNFSSSFNLNTENSTGEQNHSKIRFPKLSQSSSERKTSPAANSVTATDNFLFDDGSPISLPLLDPFDNIEMQSIGKLSLYLGEDNNSNSVMTVNSENQNFFLGDGELMTESFPISIPRPTVETNRANLLSKQVFSSIKNLKEKMKNISLRDGNKSRSGQRATKLSAQTSLSSEDFFENPVVDEQNEKHENLEQIIAETEEIFGKYRLNNSIINSRKIDNVDAKGERKNDDVDCVNHLEEKLIDFDEVHTCSDPHHDGDDYDGDCPNQFDGENNFSEPVIDCLNDVRNKIRKLICLINLVDYHQNYRHLNLTFKKDFQKFLKILMSLIDNDSDEISASVLIMDIHRIVQNLTQEDFDDVLLKLRNDCRKRNIYRIYLMKSRQNLLKILQRLQTIKRNLKEEWNLVDFLLISNLVRATIEQEEPKIQNLRIKLFRSDKY